MIVDCFSRSKGSRFFCQHFCQVLIWLAIAYLPLKANGQPVRETVNSLEWQCYQSTSIVRGVISTFHVPKDQESEKYIPEFEFLINVDEWIKGSGGETITFRQEYDRRLTANLEKWKQKKQKFLLMIDESAQRPILIRQSYPFIVQEATVPVEFWSNGARYSTSQSEYLDGVRRAVEENSRFKPTGKFEFAFGNFFAVVMPIDERLEKYAQQVLRHQNRAQAVIPYGGGLEGVSAVHALSHFRSDENIALLKKSLQDATPEWIQSHNERTRTGFEVKREYPVRQAAYHVLNDWELDVEKPVGEQRGDATTFAKAELETIAELEKDRWIDLEFSEPENGIVYVRKIEFRRDAVIPASLPDLTRLDEVHLIGFDSRKVDLAPLATATSITKVRLFGVTIDTLNPIAKMSNLQQLSVPNSTFDDLGPLDSLQKLTELDISGSRISNLEPLGDLESLRSLDVSNTSISDLGPLSNLTELQTIVAAHTSIEELQPLKPLPALKALIVEHTRIDDLQPLSNMRKLQLLDISSTNVTNLAPLANCYDLMTLTMNNTRVKDLSPLVGLPRLTWINAGETNVTDVTRLEKMSALQQLNLSGLREVNGAARLRAKGVSVLGPE